jgi:hypothetical protein
MRRVGCVLVAGVVAFTGPASGQPDGAAAPIFGVTFPPDTGTGG